MEEPGAFVLVNGLQLMRCPLPASFDEVSCARFEVAENLKVIESNGIFELSCLFYISDSLYPTLGGANWVGTLVVDNLHAVPLGRVPGEGREPFTMVLRQVPRHPSSFEFRIHAPIAA